MDGMELQKSNEPMVGILLLSWRAAIANRCMHEESVASVAGPQNDGPRTGPFSVRARDLAALRPTSATRNVARHLDLMYLLLSHARYTTLFTCNMYGEKAAKTLCCLLCFTT